MMMIFVLKLLLLHFGFKYVLIFKKSSFRDSKDCRDGSSGPELAPQLAVGLRSQRCGKRCSPQVSGLVGNDEAKKETLGYWAGSG